MKRKIVITSLIIIFIILGLLAVNDLTSSFDDFIYSLISSFRSDLLTNVLRVITSLANYKSILIYNILIILYILISKKSKLLIIPLNSILSVVFNNVFKLIFRRDRPILIALITETGYSYPSGHAMISILFFGTLSYILGKSNIKYKNTLRIIIGIFIILIGISRIYLGVHFVSDIIGGYLLGIIVLLSVITIYNRSEENESINNRSK